MAPPKKRKMMRKGLLLLSCFSVDRNGCFGVDFAVAALGVEDQRWNLQTNSNIISLRHNLDDGGEGGSEERTPQMVRKKPV